MKRYEYIEVSNEDSDFITLLNRYGLQGWEYIRTRLGGRHVFKRELNQDSRKDLQAEAVLEDLPKRARELVMYILSNTDDGVAPSMWALKNITVDRMKKTRNLGKENIKVIVDTFRKHKIYVS